MKFVDYCRKNGIHNRIDYSQLYQFFVEENGQDSTWTKSFLNRRIYQRSSWYMLFASFGGRVEFQGLGPGLLHSGLETEILRVAYEIGEGLINDAIYDYAGNNRQSGSEYWTESFKEKHIAAEISKVLKLSKERFYTNPRVNKSTFLDGSDFNEIVSFSAEIMESQAIYESQYQEFEAVAKSEGSVLRSLAFDTKRKYNLCTLERNEKEPYFERSLFRYSVVKLNEKFLVNHFESAI